MSFSIGQNVKWKWGNGWGEGKVDEQFTEDVERTIEGTEVKRNASPDDPAYLIKQDDGSRVLKSHGEIESVGK